MLTIKVNGKGTTIAAEGSVAEVMNDSARAIKAIHEALKDSDNADIFEEFIKFTVGRKDFWNKSAKEVLPEEPKEEEKAEPKDDEDEVEVPDSIKDAIAEVLKWIAQ